MYKYQSVYTHLSFDNDDDIKRIWKLINIIKQTMNKCNFNIYPENVRDSYIYVAKYKIMQILRTQKIDKKILITVDDILNNMPVLTENNKMFIFDNM